MPVVVIIYQEIEILLKAIKENIKICMLFDIKLENPDRNGYSLLNTDHWLKPTSEGIGWVCFLDPSAPAVECARLYPDGLLQTSNEPLKRKIKSCLFGSFVLETVFISVL